jgi:hypothetical protein
MSRLRQPVALPLRLRSTLRNRSFDAMSKPIGQTIRIAAWMFWCLAVGILCALWRTDLSYPRFYTRVADDQKSVLWLESYAGRTLIFYARLDESIISGVRQSERGKSRPNNVDIKWFMPSDSVERQVAVPLIDPDYNPGNPWPYSGRKPFISLPFADGLIHFAHGRVTGPKMSRATDQVFWLELIVPSWLAVLLLGIPPCILGTRVGIRQCRAHRQMKMGKCQICGYDLRASKLICPECGTKISGRACNDNQNCRS